MMTPRVKKLKNEQRSAVPTLSSERARLATEAIRHYAAETPVLQKAYMLKHILENMTIYISEGELIVGNQAKATRTAEIFPEFYSEWVVDMIDEFEDRPWDPLKVPADVKAELLEILPEWKGESFNKVCERYLTDEAKEGLASGIMTIGSMNDTTGHLNPDYYNIIRNGLKYYRNLCEKMIAENPVEGPEDLAKVDFWQAVIISIDAAVAFSKRYSRLAKEQALKEKDPVRKAELISISEICENVPLNPAKSFHEAVQFVWFMHLVMCIETNGHGMSFNRFDQYINDFYVDDLKQDRITEEQACEIIECFFIKTNDIIKVRDNGYSAAFAGYPVWQNLMIGGQLSDGSDAVNETSFLVLKSNRDVQTSQPTVSVRWHENLNEELFDYAMEMIQDGLATPAFFNDKLLIPLVQQRWGCSLEEARNMSIVACVQTSIPGYSDAAQTAGYVTPLKALELALHNGVDQVTGKQLGLKTGDPHDFSTLDELRDAMYAQIDYFIKIVLRESDIVGSLHAMREPAPFASITINDCIRKGKSLQEGGARYSGLAVAICGISNTADALAAIDTLVFKEKKLTMDELLEALHCNFEGKEDIRLMLKNKAPKYGNDIDYVDAIASDILKHYNDYVKTFHGDWRKGPLCAVIESQSFNVTQGKSIKASADGRFDFAPVNNNCSPVNGCELNGPTATIKSVGKLDQMNAENGSLYNIRFEPRSVQGAKGRETLKSVVKTYFENMGEHIQINVINNETLKAAQKNPEEYRDILVRVAGYLGYFTDLDVEVQNDIISRTAHDPQ